MRQKGTQKGFTIVELLTVMSIIIILMGVLVPALSRVRRFARVVTQKHQFYEIDKGLELYRTAHQDTYPDSNAIDMDTVAYCGAMKLCEAMLGQDGMGFHPSRRFSSPAGKTSWLRLLILLMPATSILSTCVCQYPSI
jgi:prepilin-type N-terminal cleavage/methylation domain-containing protein